MMKRLRKDTRGVVYVEFLIAFLPVFTMFLGLVQLADLHQANVVVNHSAILGVRSAVVILHDNPEYYDNAAMGQPTGKRLDDIKRAAMLPLLASRSLTEFKVNLPAQAGGDDTKQTFERDDLVRLKVQARFHCRVPLVGKMICGNKATKTLTAEAALPNHGVDYTY
jgi:hypothetical protein